MEMIAMLGGLGAVPYLENPSPIARALLKQINAATTVVVLEAIARDLRDMVTVEQERLVLQAVIAQKITDLQTPFYKKPGYWLLVAGVAAAGYHFWDKRRGGRGLFGLSGGYKIVGKESTGYRMEWAEDGTLDYAAAERECSRINDVARHNRAFRHSSAARGKCVMCGGSHPCTRSH